MALLIRLGGVPILKFSGAPQLSGADLNAETLLRMSNGAGVNMHRYKKAAGSIGGQGLMPPGLDGLDFTQPLELRLTQLCNTVGPGLVHTLSSDPRPDREPWSLALVDDRWVSTPCTRVGRVVTVTAVAGAEYYQVGWLPIFSVFVRNFSKSQDSTHSWSFDWEEA